MKIRSMRGVQIDMTAMMARNENAVAVGNVNMNARGDILGRGGKVAKSRADIAQEYHRNNPKAAKNVPLKDLAKEVKASPPIVPPSERVDVEYVDPATAVANLEKQNKTRRRKIEDND